jgi:hypothetical protein
MRFRQPNILVRTVACALAALVTVTVIGLGLLSAPAEVGASSLGLSAPSSMSLRKPSTTTAPVTTRRAPPAASVSPSPSAPRPLSAPSSPSSSSVAVPTTNLNPKLLVSGPTDPAPAGPSTGDTKLSSSAKLKLIVGGLVAVALIIAALTVGYWRHTRPDESATAGGERGEDRYDPTNRPADRPGPGPGPRPDGSTVPAAPRTAGEFGVRGQSHVTVDPASTPPRNADPSAGHQRHR